MANLRQVTTGEQVDREAESIKRFLESEKEPVIIAWGTAEGMESYRQRVGEMREVREIAERLGYARAKYEETNTGEQPEIAQRWANEMTILGWVLGDNWIGYGIIYKAEGGGG